jgi:betaine-aldehyde dehydrogenase
VLTLQTFDSERDAAELANDGVYGLGASIWTRDIDRSLRIAQELDAGTVWINDWAVVYDEFEEGGFKQSGLEGSMVSPRWMISLSQAHRVQAGSVG